MCRAITLLLLSLLTGCSTARVVRLETDRGQVLTFKPHLAEAGPVQLEEDEFMEAVASVSSRIRPPVHPQEEARRLFDMDAREGAYLFDARTRRMTPLGPGEHLEREVAAADLELTRAYLRWCERTGRGGDCLG
ncbi:hypothetical protein HG543_42940, partial [Pyxidicoccus fallax]|nr:hypothetical protein [Pyxidicoccus fallax]